jgi:hypothetical protein
MSRDAIDPINSRLKAAAIPVRVRLNGKRLVLRATLPKKPGEGEGTKQQDLSLGIPANKDGLRRIEAEAQKLGCTCLFSSPAFNEKDVVECGASNRKSWIQCSHDHRL